MTRLEKLARSVVAELGSAYWYPGYTRSQPRSVELMRRYLRMLDAKRIPPAPPRGLEPGWSKDYDHGPNY